MIGLFATGIGTMIFVRNALVTAQDEQLMDRAGSNVSAGFIDIDFDAEGQPKITLSDSAAASGYYVAIYEPGDWHRIAEAPKGRGPNWPEHLSLEQVVSQVGAFTLYDDNGHEYRASAGTINLDLGGQQVPQLVALPIDPIDKTVTTFFAIFGIFGFVTVVGGALSTRWLVTQTFRPLGQVEAAAQAISAGDFSQRLTPGDPATEVGKLTLALNTMLDRLDASLAQRDMTVKQMRRFIGDASHELRTPLVTVRGYAELYRMGAIKGDEATGQAMERIEKEALRMGAMVEDLLALARLDERRAVDFAPIDLRMIARDAAMDARAASPGRTVTVVDETAVPPPTLRVSPPRSATARAAGADRTTVDARDAADEADRRDAAKSADGAQRSDDAKNDDASTEDSSSGGTARDQRGGRRRTPATTTTTIAGATRSLLRRIPRGSSTRTAPVDVVPEIDLAPPVTGPAFQLPPVIVGEENRVRQVVANLLGNARRFTSEDSPIDITVGTDPDRISEHAPRGMGWIAISDHGEGIPEQIRTQIFERFWRADSSRTRDTGGTGLGLAIVASVMEALHGRVEVEDTPGGGATFRVWLPLAREATLYLDTQPLPELGILR